MEVKYDTIGKDYNATRQADPYLVSRLLALLQPQPGKIYLDIGCGTGNYTCALAGEGMDLVGVEPSVKMLADAKLKHRGIDWLIGSAEEIPAADQTFDGIVATLTVHHWTNIRKAFIELNRVLKDNGRIVMFTSTPEQMKGYWLNYYFPKMLAASIMQMPSLAIIQEAATEATFTITGTELYFVRNDLKDCFLYVGKSRPACYFNDQIRQGISSFSSLSSTEEVKQGLAKLRNDIDNKAFDRVKAEYDNDLGDYLFIVFEKQAGNNHQQVTSSLG